MNQIEFLAKQTEDAYDWTKQLIRSILHYTWDNIPDVIETNVSWQVWLLLMSFYFHSIMVIVGHQMDIIQKVPLKNMTKFLPMHLP